MENTRNKDIASFIIHEVFSEFNEATQESDVVLDVVKANMLQKNIEEAINSELKMVIEECAKIAEKLSCSCGNADLNTGAELASKLIAQAIRSLSKPEVRKP